MGNFCYCEWLSTIWHPVGIPENRLLPPSLAPSLTHERERALAQDTDLNKGDCTNRQRDMDKHLTPKTPVTAEDKNRLTFVDTSTWER